MQHIPDRRVAVGIDILDKDLEVAQDRFKTKPVVLKKMNAEALKFEDNSFDTVSMAYSLHHLDRRALVSGEMHRVLKPGGSLIIQEEFCDGNQTEAQKTNLQQHAWDAEIDSLLGVTHNKTLTRRNIKDIVSNLRLKEVEIFESTHYVKCLFCENKFACEDPRSKKIIKQAIKEINNALTP